MATAEPAPNPVFIKRTTMFKMPRDEDMDTVIDAFKVVRETARKDGKPYLVSLDVGRTAAASDPRAQGWTLVANTIFNSKEDMEYWDKDCEAHRELRKIATPLHQGVMTVYFESPILI